MNVVSDTYYKIDKVFSTFLFVVRAPRPIIFFCEKFGECQPRSKFYFWMIEENEKRARQDWSRPDRNTELFFTF